MCSFELKARRQDVPSVVISKKNKTGEQGGAELTVPQEGRGLQQSPHRSSHTWGYMKAVWDIAPWHCPCPYPRIVFTLIDLRILLKCVFQALTDSGLVSWKLRVYNTLTPPHSVLGSFALVCLWPFPSADNPTPPWQAGSGGRGCSGAVGFWEVLLVILTGKVPCSVV